jgi:hypothetical protein
MGFVSFFWHFAHKHPGGLTRDLDFYGKTLVFQRKNQARAVF